MKAKNLCAKQRYKGYKDKTNNSEKETYFTNHVQVRLVLQII